MQALIGKCCLNDHLGQQSTEAVDEDHGKKEEVPQRHQRPPPADWALAIGESKAAVFQNVERKGAVVNALDPLVRPGLWTMANAEETASNGAGGIGIAA